MIISFHFIYLHSVDPYVKIRVDMEMVKCDQYNIKIVKCDQYNINGR